MMCGDFNAHSALWGHPSRKNIRQGLILEEYLEIHDYVCLNDGRGTYVGSSGIITPLDLTFVSQDIATSIDWDIIDDVFGSDHFPVISTISPQGISQGCTPPLSKPSMKRWNSKKINWSIFSYDVNRAIFKVNSHSGPIEMYDSIVNAIQDSRSGYPS